MIASTTPSEDQITQMYETGELSTELAEYHFPADDGKDVFLQRCIDLHNNGNIDLIAVPSQLAFSQLDVHSFFTAQQFYCNAIPHLHTTAAALMECCRILIEQAGSDGVANMPNGAFREWCKNNAKEAASVIQDAQAGGALARNFVTFALQGINDIDTAIAFVQEYADDRQIFGMSALGNMTYADGNCALKAMAVVEPFITSGNDDTIRLNALSAAFGILRQQGQEHITRRLIEASSNNPGPQTLYGLAQLLFQSYSLLDIETTGIVLRALQVVDSEHQGTIRLLDNGLQRMLGTPSEALALDFLTEKLRDGKLTVEHFQSTAHKLMTEDSQRLYELIARWLLSGSVQLGNTVSHFIRAGKERVFDTTAQSLGLASDHQLLLCRKTIGFLFLYPTTCCSILVSILRVADENVRTQIGGLMFDHILMNYSGSAKDYLESLPNTDAAYGPVHHALGKLHDFHVAVDAIGSIRELHPSERQRNAMHQRSYDQMRDAHKEAQKSSVIMNLVHHSTILHGKRTLTYVADPGGQRRAIEMDLMRHSAYVELPGLERLDPVGLDYMLRVLKLEKVA